MKRRNFIRSGVAVAVAGAIPAPFIWPRGASAAPSVKMGILHSLTGTIAIAEKSVVDAEMLAVEEINAAGGIRGYQIEAVIEDGASDWPTFAEKAKKLIGKDKVAAVQGCYTSASRKAVLPVFEKMKGLLYYPTYYEGLEISPNIMYTAQEATQSSIAATEWLVKNKGDTFYMVGSDYIWPRTTIKLSSMTLKRLGGKSLGETFFPLGHIEWSSAINKIKASKPKVVLNCVVGGSNVAFFKQMKAAGIIDDPDITVLSLAVSEEEVSGIGRENAASSLTLMGYFQSLENTANKKFVSAFKAKYGEDRVTGDTLACGYTGVYLWKDACEKADSFAVQDVVAASSELPINGPEGSVKFHKDNHHLWKYARVGEFLPNGQVNMIYESDLIEPDPFPKVV
jgi:urea transport system substrate-binding protein